MPDDTVDAIIEALKKLHPRQAGELDAVWSAYEAAKDQAETDRKAGKLHETELANYTKMAKAIPDLAKGLNATISAFQSGDGLGGAAGIMDICSTAATLLGSLASASSALGPLGALAGAIFSVVGMILRVFQPKQKGVGEVIEGKLRLISAEGVSIRLQTAIDELESLYAGYPERGPAPIKQSELTALAEGNAADHLFHGVNWLLLDANTKEESIAGNWLDILTASLHAGSLQLRNLTHLLSIAREGDYAALHRTYKQIAVLHLDKMTRLLVHARGKATVWHIGDDGAVTGGQLYSRRGLRAEWTSHGGGQRTFALVKDPKNSVRHVIVLEGDASEMSFFSFPLFPHHRCAHVNSIGGEWGSGGTGWTELALGRPRDVTAIPGDEADELYLFGVDVDGVFIRKIKRTPQGVEIISSDTHAVSGDELLRIRVLPGYRPASDVLRTPLYVLKGRGGDHLIQGGLDADRVLHPSWPQIRGIEVDPEFLWIWKEDAIACMTHTRAQELLNTRADADTCKAAWVWYYTTNAEVLHRDPEHAIPELRGLRALASCADGTLLVVHGMRMFTGTLVASTYSNSFMVEWADDIGVARAHRVAREPIESWVLFEQRLRTLQQIAGAVPSRWYPREL